MRPDLFLPLLLTLHLTAAWAHAQARWTAREDMRIGSVNDPATLLTTVGSISVGPRGALYVVQYADNLIRVFDSAGKPMSSIGRRGQGPGEFQGIASIGFLADTLYATDISSRRVSFFARDGRFIVSHPMMAPSLGDGLGTALAFRLLPGGSGIAIPSIAASAITTGSATKAPFLRIDRTGKILDTIAWYALTNAQITLSKGDRRTYSGQFFADNPIVAFALDSSGSVTIERRAATTASAGAFRIVRQNLRGDTIFSRAHRYTPAAMPRGLVDSLVTARARVFMTRDNPMFASVTEAEQALRAALFLPRFKIPVAAAQFSEDGTLWLRRDSADEPLQQWDVFSGSGDRIAAISLPRKFNIRLIRRDVIWGTELDDADVPFVVRYRILRAGQSVLTASSHASGAPVVFAERGDLSLREARRRWAELLAVSRILTFDTGTLRDRRLAADGHAQSSWNGLGGALDEIVVAQSMRRLPEQHAHQQANRRPAQ
jgi:hypothetical protein